MSTKKPTMRDIAREVGTSAVTVSKAMAGKPGMSDELRKTILKKASEMGYAYPHSRLLPREHLEIGILIPDRYFESDSFYAEIYKRLVKKVTDLGHFGLLELLDPLNEKELTLPSLLTTKKVDGVSDGALTADKGDLYISAGGDVTLGAAQAATAADMAMR